MEQSWGSLLASIAFVLSLCGCSTSGIYTPLGDPEAYNLSPASRTVKPVKIAEIHGQAENSNALLSSSSTAITLHGLGSYVVLDFGKEAGGIIGAATRQRESAATTRPDAVPIKANDYTAMWLGSAVPEPILASTR